MNDDHEADEKQYKSSVHMLGNKTIIAMWMDYTYYEIDEAGHTSIGTMSEKMANTFMSSLGMGKVN